MHPSSLPHRPALLASGHAGNADSPRQVGPRYREADRRGTGKEVRFRGGILRGHSHVVAKAQAPDVVAVRRTLLLAGSQGSYTCILYILYILYIFHVYTFVFSRQDGQYDRTTPIGTEF